MKRGIIIVFLLVTIVLIALVTQYSPQGFAVNDGNQSSIQITRGIFPISDSSIKVTLSIAQGNNPLPDNLEIAESFPLGWTASSAGPVSAEINGNLVTWKNVRTISLYYYLKPSTKSGSFLGMWQANNTPINWVGGETMINLVTFNPCSRADFNRDGKVNSNDTKILIKFWGSFNCEQKNWCNGTDMNHDSRVDTGDLQFLASKMNCVYNISEVPTEENGQTSSGDQVETPPEVTDSSYANNPANWLVVYNKNNSESVEWVNWYKTQRNIPDQNLFALELNQTESLSSTEEFISKMKTPIKNHISGNVILKRNIIGIIVGYNVPGIYGTKDFNEGGYSVTNSLQNLNDLGNGLQKKEYNIQEMRFALRLGRGNMPDGYYMTARIDAPNLDSTKTMTIKAKTIASIQKIPSTDKFYFDYTGDGKYRNTKEWSIYWLQNLSKVLKTPGLKEIYEKESGYILGLSNLPWTRYDEVYEQTPNDAMRFGFYSQEGWDDGRLNAQPAGIRAIAYSYSDGTGITLKDTKDYKGRFAPNALEAGYASVLSSTGPTQGDKPVLIDFLICLREGWNIGESFYIAEQKYNSNWELVGDPFMTINLEMANEPIPISQGS